jgi:hypothetical protein
METSERTEILSCRARFVVVLSAAKDPYSSDNFRESRVAKESAVLALGKGTTFSRAITMQIDLGSSPGGSAAHAALFAGAFAQG